MVLVLDRGRRHPKNDDEDLTEVLNRPSRCRKRKWRMLKSMASACSTATLKAVAVEAAPRFVDSDCPNFP